MLAVDHGPLMSTTASHEKYGDIAIMMLAGEPLRLAAAMKLAWNAGALPEFAQIVRRHEDSSREQGRGLCHQVAFEFVYSLVITAKLHNQLAALKGWTWCMADRTNGYSEHSWIERYGEAMSADYIADPTNLREGYVALLVMPAALYRQHQSTTNVESRTFEEVARFIEGEFNVLFPKHRVLSDAARVQRDHILDKAREWVERVAS